MLYSFSCVQLSVLKLHLSTPLPSHFSWAATMSAEARTGSETRPALKINTCTIEALFYASKTDWLSYFSLLKSYGPHRAALPWEPALQQWSKTLPETNLLIRRALKGPCAPHILSAPSTAALFRLLVSEAHIQSIKPCAEHPGAHKCVPPWALGGAGLIL